MNVPTTGAPLAASDLFSVKGKVVAITGAAQGVGRDLSLGFARAGARVVAIDLQAEPLKDLSDEIVRLGSEALSFALDLRNVASVNECFQEVLKRWGGLDVLCNNAGVNVHKDSTDLTEDEWDFVLDVNLKALFFCCQAAARVMAPAREGRIINTASTFGIVGFPQRAAYCASKGGVVQLTRALALEWAPLGIRVNAVAPAAVWTPSRAELFSNEDFMRSLLAKLPLGRLARTSDVLAATIFLASPASEFVTGQVIVVDGGWTAA
ncbi:MAG: SDR family oxidoreductase [Bacillota bacterium]|nr:MAG: SDR family oxidoreductase [Bacillota bacterium]